MTVGIDAACLSVKEKQLKAGVYYLAYNLLKQISFLDKKNQYLLYSFSPIPGEILYSFSKHMKNKVLLPEKFWMSLRLSWEMFLKKPDIFLGLGQALPFYHPSKNIVFVYDLAFESYPECYPGSCRRLSRQTKYSTVHADKVIAISNSTKEDLIKLYGVKKEKIEVIYPGFDLSFSPQSKNKIEKIRIKYKLNKPYFLFVGSLKPIKNVPAIIEAFAGFIKKTKKDYELVLSGSDFWLDENISKRVERLRLKTKVRNLGYVSKKDLPALYSGAFAFVSPSLYEGFGMPLLEAMACGVPVITSNLGSMPEVVDKAAILVDSKKFKQIKNAMLKLDKDRKLRERLIKKGLIQSNKFSWKKFTCSIFKTINDL